MNDGRTYKPGDVLAERYSEYVTLCVDPRAGEVQRQETRRAFYAGARAVLTALLSITDSAHEPAAEDVAALEALNQELCAFADEVAKGRA